MKGINVTRLLRGLMRLFGDARAISRGRGVERIARRTARKSVRKATRGNKPGGKHGTSGRARGRKSGNGII